MVRKFAKHRLREMLAHVDWATCRKELIGAGSGSLPRPRGMEFYTDMNMTSNK